MLWYSGLEVAKRLCSLNDITSIVNRSTGSTVSFQKSDHNAMEVMSLVLQTKRQLGLVFSVIAFVPRLIDKTGELCMSWLTTRLVLSNIQTTRSQEIF